MANASQPASIKTENGRTNFGGSVVDGNRVAMVGVGSWFQTQDATSPTNVVSPLTNASASAVSTIVVPANAITVTILPSVACQVSEVSGSSSLSQSFNIPANTLVTLPVARLQNIYLLPSNATNTIQFFFTTV